MTAQMHKLAEQQEFERAQEIKKRIKSLDLLQQEQSFNSSLISVDFFACVSKLDRTGICILSVRDGKIRGTKTYYFNDDYSDEQDNLLSRASFSPILTLTSIEFGNIISVLDPNIIKPKRSPFIISLSTSA